MKAQEGYVSRERARKRVYRNDIDRCWTPRNIWGSRDYHHSLVLVEKSFAVVGDEYFASAKMHDTK
jgi:hypothetical protein